LARPVKYVKIRWRCRMGGISGSGCDILRITLRLLWLRCGRWS